MSPGSSTDAITPVFFGQDSDLYGCFHLTADYEHSPVVLICQPTGHEYERCHRAMRQLAVQSTRRGLSAMRFDYYSTGDSAGNSDELSLSRMQLDIKQAIKYCRRKTGVERLTLVGLRLGATLAAQLAGACSEVDSLVLYAPVLDGETLLTEWQREQQDFYAKHSHIAQPASDGEVLGFPVTDNFRRELSRKFVPDANSSTLRRVLILIDEADSASASLNEWIETYKSLDVAVTLEVTEDIAIWRREPMDAIVPARTIRRIVKWFEES